MKLTEQQARTKVCPMMSYQGHNGAYQTEPIRCIASDCMLWRWRDNQTPEFIAERYKHSQDRPEPQGFCGLSN